MTRTLALAVIFYAIALPLFAQRNFIDVPSSEIVKSKVYFFQQQFGFTKGEINTGSIFTYGLGKRFEIGVAVYKLTIENHKGVKWHEADASENPELLINAQQGLIGKKWFALSVGTRSGITTGSADNEARFATFDYVNSKFTLAEGLYQIILGTFYANDAYAGSGTNFGVMGGVNVVAVKNKVNLLADFFSGNSSMSMINCGVQVSLKKRWKILGAAQFGVPGSGNDNGATIQLSKN